MPRAMGRKEGARGSSPNDGHITLRYIYIHTLSEGNKNQQYTHTYINILGQQFLREEGGGGLSPCRFPTPLAPSRRGGVFFWSSGQLTLHYLTQPERCFQAGPGQLPCTTTMLPWWELPKAQFACWHPGRIEELTVLQQASFKVGAIFKGVRTAVTASIQLGYVHANHHHLWSECGCQGCVSCRWTHCDRLARMFVYDFLSVGEWRAQMQDGWRPGPR